MNDGARHRQLPGCLLILVCLYALVAAPAEASRGSVPLPTSQRLISPAATLATFAGTWVGHTRFLTITRHGIATETLGDGCCDPIIDLRFRLSRPRGSQTNATATATVTAVVIHDRNAFTPAHPAPRRGQTATITLKRGIIRDPLTDATYCGASAAGRCGA